MHETEAKSEIGDATLGCDTKGKKKGSGWGCTRLNAQTTATETIA
jgi:hypothetical protein